MTAPERTLSRGAAFVVIGTLAAVVLLNVGVLGSDPWAFRPGTVAPRGALAFVVRLAHERWDLGLLRSLAMLAGLGLVALGAAACFVRRWRAWVLVAASVVVLLTLLVPAVALQTGLRQSTAPWFFDNDSTYQIELAGRLVLHGHTPYGHAYAGTGLVRFYSLDGSVPPGTVERQVALRHFAYFPGIALLAAPWQALPAPFGDVRWLVALATLGLLGAALLFPGPLFARLALGVALAGNPLAVRAAWFGTADAVTLLLLVLAFALLLRRHPAWGAALLAGALLTKQFAVVAVPFWALALLLREGRGAWRRPLLAFAAVLLAGIVPFLAADAGGLWRDTVSYGAGTYRIVGYGLSALLLRAHVIHDRQGSYPFFPLVLLVWLPVTAALAWGLWRRRELWLAGAGFTVCVFLLLFLGRVFQISYLVYPLAGIALTLLLLAARERET